MNLDAYHAFVEAKVPTAGGTQANLLDSQFSSILKPHQRTAARWMVEGGRRACFMSFGLGKSAIQLEACRVARQMVMPGLFDLMEAEAPAEVAV